VSHKKRPGKSPHRRQARRKQAFPAWAMLLLGTISGLAIATFLIVGGVLDDPRSAAPDITDLTQQGDQQEPPQAPQSDDLEFDFYDTLAGQDAASNSETPAVSRVPKTRPTLIQVGSFRRQADAEALKAQLAFLGLVANIRRAAVEGVQWHRVVLGPYPGSRAAEVVRRQLLEHGFKAQLRYPAAKPAG